MNARPEQLRVTQMNRSSKNSRDSCAAEEVCPIRGMSVEKTLATAGVVRDNAVINKFNSQCPVTRAGSTGRCNTIWYKAVFKGGVYDPRETVWAFGGAEPISDRGENFPQGNKMVESLIADQVL